MNKCHQQNKYQKIHLQSICDKARYFCKGITEAEALHQR